MNGKEETGNSSGGALSDLRVTLVWSFQVFIIASGSKTMPKGTVMTIQNELL